MNLRDEWKDESNSISDIYYTRDETISDVVANFDIRRNYSAEGCSIIIDNTTTEHVIIQDHSNPINENKTDKKMLLPMDTTAKSGSYVTYRDEIWLIISRINIVDDAYKSCQIYRCNYTLLFQSTTGTILSHPCIDDSSSSIGLDANNTITTLNGVHHIKLPFDDNTKLIGIDRRFFLDRNGKTTYKITNVNNTTYNYGDKGLIEFTLQQCETEDDDRADLGICNYFEPTTTPVPSPITGFIMTISASGELIAGGSLARTFTPKLVNSEGVEQTFTVAWTFNYNTMPTSDFTITYDGNKCKIKVAEDYEIIDKILVLTCTTSDGLYSARYDAIITA